MALQRKPYLVCLTKAYRLGCSKLIKNGTAIQWDQSERINQKGGPSPQNKF